MISIFAKPTYLEEDLKRNSGEYLCRKTTRVRAEEVVEYLKGRLNPKEGYENDVCIYIKYSRLDNVKDGAYVDVLDDKYVVELLKKRPGIKVIAMSQIHYKFLKETLKNEVILIPHHHVNFEEVVRSRKKIINCGFVGPNSSHHVSVNKLVKEELEKIGFNFTPLLNFKVRKDIIDYYKTIDIQVIGYFNYYEDSPYRHPTKIINAASFGIPTIAAPILGYEEVEGFYIPAGNMESLLAEAVKLRDKKYYSQWSEKIIKEAKKYHISKIAKLYKQL
ncbi:hypothetical protein A3E66_04415 [Candidatus Daviesbacteria bacterium RIFCSPHIGHO2_12_FULL_37_16]|uniref:Glycosyltransferase n=2 Tax=Candidatus Daviesiibacteriota TaxID=1752718 RepID=A0A0G0EJL5_9BACT|nr:MAG: hypothetical protein US19_C0051G0005 [Candidatus Daviesbacteria bacterium GW2011_GWB1_36_5]OGE32560.1 MAG: hypothetical protein A3C99_00255 [Candidatus Daviesbacteria bacterium RIFCSPHIGHO2_02_FULL_37_9]OGE35679.1 MAG: hypothetical protein A3E66_04415 [Candidatus Daviesbacteria bacterium RIFCSPHIGHO2_12_FULL_37_16]